MIQYFIMTELNFSSLMKKVGAVIIKQREVRHVTQRKLAHDAKVSQFYLGTVEHGKANPSLGLLKRITDALDIPVTSLFED